MKLAQLTGFTLMMTLAACGAPDEGEFFEPVYDFEGNLVDPEPFDPEPGEIGQVGQAIFLSANYGHEAGDDGSGTFMPKCASPWANSTCRVPDNKFLQVGFQAGTCSSWWQARFVNAFASMQQWVQAFNDDEWILSGPIVDDPYQMKCEAGTGGTALAAFGPSTNPSDNDVHVVLGYGQLYQYRKGTLKVFHQKIEAQPEWAGKTELAKQLYAENTIKHELMHLMGHGHFPGCGPELMRSCADNSWYTGIKTPRTDERTAQKCYNEDSGTTDDCNG